MVLFSIVFGGLLNVDSGDVPYPVFSYVALVPWSFFSSGISSATRSILTNKGMVQKVYFPRETLVIAAILGAGVDYLISLLITFGLLLFFGMPLHLTIALVPLVFVTQLLLMVGISFFTATISVFIRDISFVINFVMQAWMYLSPVIYPIDSVSDKIRPFMIALNPMTIIIESYRDVIIHGQLPNFGLLAFVGALGLLAILLGYRYFKRAEETFADVL